MLTQDAPKISIRPRSPSDIEACLAVLTQVHAQDGYPIIKDVTFHDFIANVPYAWVALTDDGGIVGHVGVAEAVDGDLAVRIWRETHGSSTNNAIDPKADGRVDGNDDSEPRNEHGKPDIAVLKRLFVLPSARGSGVASKLIDAAVQEFARRGMRLVLYVLEKDGGARQLYERLGWEKYGTGEFRWGEGGVTDATCFASPLGGEG